MNQQETQLVIARDEKWVPSTERFKISFTNVRLETTTQHKEETFRVAIDVIKNSTCFKAFTITTEVPEILMQQFWYTIKKVKDSESYEFLLDNKKCIVDAEVFRKILDICPRGMLYRENVDYPELIWEDFAFQIDHMKERKSRRKTIPFPRFTKDDGIVCRLKFVRIREDYQEYGLPIPDMMLNDKIKHSESYQKFIKYSSESELEPAKKKTGSKSSRGVVIKDPPKQEASNIMQAFKKSKKTNRRQPGIGGSNEGTGRIPRVLDESTVISANSHEGTGTKLGVLDEEKVIFEANVILKWGSENESEHSDDSQINFDDIEMKDKDGNVDGEGDDHISDIQDTDDEDAETKSDEDEIYKYKICVRKDEDEEMLNAKVEDSGNGDAKISDVVKADAKKIKEIKDDAKKAELPITSSNLFVSSGFGDQFLKLSSDTSLVSTIKDTTDAEINSLLDIKIQSKVPHIQSPSILTVPILVISEPSVPTPIPKNPSVAPSTTLLLPPSVFTIPHVPHQTTTPIPTPLVTTDAPTITTAVPASDALSVVQLRVAKLEKDVSELKKIDHSAKALATLKSQVPTVVEQYLGSKIGDDLQKSALKIRKIKREQAKKQKMPKYTIKSNVKAALKEYDLKSDLYQTMHENKSFNRNPTNHALYHALIKALIDDENPMDKGVADTVKNHKRQHDDNDDDDKEDPSGGLNQGSKTGKSASAKEPVEEPIAEVVMYDAVNIAGEDVVCDDDQPQDTLEPKTNKTPNQDWFKQPPRPRTPDLEWNKCQVVLG
ncbi:hypothetical protein Tco_0077247 [Tanacetum coccineum]